MQKRIISMNKYDIAVVYRIYPKVSKVPPIFPNDKLKLSELCLASFREALKGINFKLYVIFDNCPQEYNHLFRKYFPDDECEFLNIPHTGNGGTFKMQMDILLNQNLSDIVYFAEDDYFYLPDAFHTMLNLMNSSDAPDFISPYDHFDYYNTFLHSYDYAVAEIDGKKWRTASSTCMTFMTKKRTLESSRKIFYSYAKNNYDASLWMSLTKTGFFPLSRMLKLKNHSKEYRRIVLKLLFYGINQIVFGKKYKLYSPMPSLCTHMDNQCLAPGFNWSEIFKKYLEKINFCD